MSAAGDWIGPHAASIASASRARTSRTDTPFVKRSDATRRAGGPSRNGEPLDRPKSARTHGVCDVGPDPTCSSVGPILVRTRGPDGTARIYLPGERAERGNEHG